MNPQTQRKMNAKDFRQPLLKVLGNLTGYVPNVPVSFRDTYSPVFTILGITRDQFGVEAATKIPWSERWTQSAFHWLVDQGLGMSPGRGQWALTPQGVVQAQALTGNAPTTPAQVTQAVAQAVVQAAAAPAAPVPATPAAPPPPVVQVAPVLAPVAVSGVVIPDGMYHPDPYIRHLGLKDHPCLGFFTAASPICPGCPARLVCQETMASKLSQLAATLAEEDEAAAAPVVAPAAKPAPAAPSTPAASGLRPATGGLKIPSTAKVNMTTCQAPAKCRGCNNEITVNEDMAWVRGIGTDGKGSAVFHKACYEAAKAAG